MVVRRIGVRIKTMEQNKTPTITNIEIQKLECFIQSTLKDIMHYNNLDHELSNKDNFPLLHFVPDENYGDELKKIDPAAKYTNENNNLGYGKTIFKNGKCHIIIRNSILSYLLQTGFKGTLGKYVVFHEFGHYVNYSKNTHPIPQESPIDRCPIFEICQYTFSVAVDEYMANNNIIFLLSEEDCKNLLIGNTLYSDLEKLYDSINDQYGLFSRFWNSSNSICINLLKHIPIFIKSGGFKETQELEKIDIKRIVTALERPERSLDNLFYHLLRVYNSFVDGYNSVNPLVLQKTVKLQME
jgi:hypothetical protein